MKTKLLYIASFLLAFFTSCSVDENSVDPSAYEKELKVKNLIDAFSKDIIPSVSFSKFVEEVQTKSSSGLTEAEMAQLEQEFLSQQSSKFVELYYYVEALGLSEDQLRVIIIEYLNTVNKSSSNETKNNSDECAFGEAGESDSLFALILSIICEEDKREDDTD